MFAISSSAPYDVSHFVGDSTGASYAIAQFIMKVVDWLLAIFGLEHHQTIVTFLYATVVLLLAIVVGRIFQWLILNFVRAVAKRWSSDIYHSLTDVRFFHKVCRIIPPLVFLILIQFTLSNHNALSSWLTKLSFIYICFVLAVTLTALAVTLTALVVAVWKHLDAKENKRKLPLNGLAQLVKGIIWILTAIIVVAILVDKSPAALLAGLGAFAAVLMLVFKDTILGFVAGIQMAQNDMLHVGDWIVVPDTDANGVVEYVSLSTVKVRNFDNTIITVPPYTLVSKSFQNWRGMTDSGVRRVCYTLCIAPASVVPATSQITAGLEAKYPILKQFASALKPPQTAVCEGGAAPWNGSVSTNLGLFRAYLVGVLLHDEHVSPEPNLMVNLSNPTADGLPMQIYYFVRTTDWVAYEGLKSTMMERIVTELRDFGLQITELTDLSVTTVKEA